MLTGEEQMCCTSAKIFRNFIAAKGLNMSRQRALILDAFLSEGPRMSVDDLYIRLRTQHPTLGRATVYRTLKLLVECGIARAFIVDGVPVKYEKYQSAEDKTFMSAPQTETEFISERKRGIPC
jgi:Fe2+ or Zn2+ uptake regulation protein